MDVITWNEIWFFSGSCNPSLTNYLVKGFNAVLIGYSTLFLVLLNYTKGKGWAVNKSLGNGIITITFDISKLFNEVLLSITYTFLKELQLLFQNKMIKKESLFPDFFPHCKNQPPDKACKINHKHNSINPINQKESSGGITPLPLISNVPELSDPVGEYCGFASRASVRVAYICH